MLSFYLDRYEDEWDSTVAHTRQIGPEIPPKLTRIYAIITRIYAIISAYIRDKLTHIYALIIAYIRLIIAYIHAKYRVYTR